MMGQKKSHLIKTTVEQARTEAFYSLSMLKTNKQTNKIPLDMQTQIENAINIAIPKVT